MSSLENGKEARLHVLIAGAGIGGLSASIALRQAGHRVEVFESSRFATELGAAIHLPPNVNGLLRRFGMKPEDFHCNDAEFVTVFDSQGNTVSSKDMRDLRKNYPYPWQLSHRIDLHETLKSVATSPDGPGIPVVIHLRCKVVDCDPEEPSLTLADGNKIRGDLVIGADGVHSALRKTIAQEDLDPVPSGGSAFRFLIPIARVKANPETQHLVARPGELQLWDGTYRRLVIYPCRNNTELNFVCLHPDSESKGSTEGWNNTGSLGQLLQVYDEFCPAMKALLRMVDADSIKLWRLLDRSALNTWIRGKACLLGDAAHPFLPHQGQGGAQAIEDGAALGALLPLGTTPEDIPRRLELYMKCRYDRATLVQNFSRQAAFKTSPHDHVGGTSTDPLEFSQINFGHDAFDSAESMLLKTLGDTSRRASALTRAFGPAPKMLPDHPDLNQTFGIETTNSIQVTFRTRRNYLETFLPDVQSRVRVRGGWATASFVLRHHQPGSWRGGAGHTSVALCIPNVLALPTDVTVRTIVPFVFDTSAEFALAAREEWGLPVLPSDIDEHSAENGIRTWMVGRSGHAFLSITTQDGGPSEGASNGVSSVAKANVDIPNLSGVNLSVAFPTLEHVVRRLKGLEIAEVVEVRET